MSSLLQSTGKITSKGVELFFYLVKKGPTWEKYNGLNSYKPDPDSTTFTDPVEEITLTNGNKAPWLYRVWRKPRALWGNWVVFVWNKQRHAPDLSCPIETFQLPKDAKKLTKAECIKYWESYSDKL